MKYLYFLNPIKWIKAFQFSKKQSQFDKSTFDLELWLYSQILTNKMLHYGYFEDVNIKPDTISLKQVEEAQLKYAQNIVDKVKDKKNLILDVGCGMGGLSELMINNKMKVEALTPNQDQINFIKVNLPSIPTHQCKFENFKIKNKYGTVINSESLQYIPLDDAFQQLDKILLPKGRWIIVDYFRLHNQGINKSSHFLEDFRKKVEEYNWTITFEKDITLNILPTIAFVTMYVNRFLLPLKHFAFEKFRWKSPKLYYMTEKIRHKIDSKIAKEIASVDPAKFLNEKKYMFFVLDKK